MKLTKIVITVGIGLRASGAPISADSLTVMEDSASKYMLDTCGGYSWHRVAGGWQDERGHPWVEPGLQITATVDPRRTIPAQRIAADLRDIFDQKCVALEVSEVDFCLI